MFSLRPNKQRAFVATMFLWSILAIRISFIIICLLNILLVDSNEIAAINRGETFIETGSQSAEMSSSINYVEKPVRIAEIIGLGDLIVSIIYLLTSIGSAIVFIMWFRRAYYNLHMRVPGLRFKEGWAAGSWFVPGLNLFRPLQIMQEMYRVTAGLVQHRKGFKVNSLSTKILSYWWAFELSYWILSRVAKKLLKNATVDQIVPLSFFYLVLYVVGVLSAIITIRVINNYSKAEQLLATDEADDEFEPEYVLAYDSGFE